MVTLLYSQLQDYQILQLAIQLTIHIIIAYFIIVLSFMLQLLYWDLLVEDFSRILNIMARLFKRHLA